MINYDDYCIEYNKNISPITDLVVFATTNIFLFFLAYFSNYLLLKGGDDHAGCYKSTFCQDCTIVNKDNARNERTNNNKIRKTFAIILFILLIFFTILFVLFINKLKCFFFTRIVNAAIGLFGTIFIAFNFNKCFNYNWAQINPKVL